MAEQQKKDEKKTKKVPVLRVIAKRDGFRRAARAWHGTMDVPLSELSKEQIKQLKEEPLLSVAEIDVEVEG